jgi:hypothetical protein
MGADHTERAVHPGRPEPILTLTELAELDITDWRRHLRAALGAVDDDRRSA